jgi:hypothetical protein
MELWSPPGDVYGRESDLPSVGHNVIQGVVIHQFSSLGTSIKVTVLADLVAQQTHVELKRGRLSTFQSEAVFDKGAPKRLDMYRFLFRSVIGPC